MAAVVLHALVHEGRSGLTLADVAIACERDPSAPEEMREITQALEILTADGLAQRRGELFCPTRAAVRADELSF